ncbi:MAG: putative 2OG-Fe(II) oxygenase [Rickettsiales bacterium]|nr:putative 2OG-Fe(II) oxygenase [Rickettsiales bacterium]
MNQRLKKTLWDIEEHFDSQDHGQAYHGGYFSQNFTFEEDYEGFKGFKRYLMDSIRYYLNHAYSKEYSLNVDPDNPNISLNGWLEIIGTGDYQSPHSHVNSLLSCIYFIDTPNEKSTNNESCIDILSPNAANGTKSLLLEAHNHYSVIPKEGALVIYPSDCSIFMHPHSEENEIIQAKIQVNIDTSN